MDAEMLYHKDAVFWLTNFKRIHSPPPHPLGVFFHEKAVLGVCGIIIFLRDVLSQPNTDQSIG